MAFLGNVRNECIGCIICADKGYDYDDVRQGVLERHYQAHTKQRRVQVTEIPAEKRHPARRRVVERTLSWQNDFCSLHTRCAKKANNWLALIEFACALVLCRIANEL